MKKAIQPYLHFDEKCEEAMRHYQQLFGGELDIMSIGQSPAKDEFPKEIHHQILHASLSHGDFKFMASDMCGMGELHLGNSVQLSLDCGSLEEIQTLFEKLSDGGQVIQNLEKQFWGSLFAMVVDKYGVRWMLSFDENQGES